MGLLGVFGRCPWQLARAGRFQGAQMLEGSVDGDIRDEMRPEPRDTAFAKAMALLVAPRVKELDHLFQKPLPEGARIEVQQRSKRALAAVRGVPHAGSSCLRRAIATTSARRETSSSSARRPNGVMR